MFNKVRIPEWPLIHLEAIPALIDVYFSKYWSWYGKYERRFTKKFLKIIKARYGILCSSGTSALELCLNALDIKEGDEVIVPAYTWMATATAVVRTGATPVFVDIDEKTLCISPSKIEEAITEKTKAIIPVHLFSAVADMNSICKIAKEHNIKIIEDNAHAIGAIYKNHYTGTMSNVSAFSFQQSKLLSSGEGGMCVTNDPKIAMKIDKLCHIGFSMFVNNNENINPTKNLLTEFQAAMLDNQCNYLLKETKLRVKRANYLESLLSDLPYVRFQEIYNGTTQRAYYQFVFLIDSTKIKSGYNLQNILSDLNKKGIPAQNTFGTVAYKFFAWNIPQDKYIKKDCPIAEKISENEAICLPHTVLISNKSTIKKIAKIIRTTLEQYF